MALLRSPWMPRPSFLRRSASRRCSDGVRPASSRRSFSRWRGVTASTRWCPFRVSAIWTASPVGRVGLAPDQAGTLEPIEPLRRGAGGQHQRFRELARAQPERFAASAEASPGRRRGRHRGRTRGRPSQLRLTCREARESRPMTPIGFASRSGRSRPTARGLRQPGTLPASSKSSGAAGNNPPLRKRFLGNNLLGRSMGCPGFGGPRRDDPTGGASAHRASPIPFTGAATRSQACAGTPKRGLENLAYATLDGSTGSTTAPRRRPWSDPTGRVRKEGGARSSQQCGR